MKWLDNFIVSERGQWDHPGKPTAVPTKDGRITMQGVQYPVFAMDETGYGGMIYPGGNYQFRGKMVYEIPMAKDGYMLPGRFRNPEGNWLSKYQDGNEVKVKPTFLLPKEEQERYYNSLLTRQKPTDPIDITLDAASFVPGPIGMGASAIGLGKNLQEGDYTGAVLDAANVLTAGAAKYFNWAKGAAKSAGASRVARSMADKADFLEKASNPNIYKTIGLGRDLYNYSYPESESKYFTTEDDYNFAKPSTTDVKKPGLPIKPLILKGNGGDISIPDLSRPNWLDKAQKGQQVKYYDDYSEYRKANKAYQDSLSMYNKYPIPSGVPLYNIGRNEFDIENTGKYNSVIVNKDEAIASSILPASMTYAPEATWADKRSVPMKWVYKKPTQKPVYKEKPREYIPTKTPRLEREPLQLVMPQSDRTLMPYNNTRQVLRGIQEEDKSNENLYPTRVVPAPDFQKGGWLEQYQDGSQVVPNLPGYNPQAGPTIKNAELLKQLKMQEAVRNSQSLNLPSGAIQPTLGPIEYAMLPGLAAPAIKAAMAPKPPVDAELEAIRKILRRNVTHPKVTGPAAEPGPTPNKFLYPDQKGWVTGEMKPGRTSVEDLDDILIDKKLFERMGNYTPKKKNGGWLDNY